MLKITLLLMLFLISCGKAPSDSNEGNRSGNNADNDRPLADIQDFIKEHRVSCGEERCPEYMARVMIADKEDVKYCSGILVNENTVVTASSCFPRNLRIGGVDCRGRVYALFANNEETEISFCETILEADKKVSFLEPAMWKGDYLLFTLSKRVKHSPAVIASQGAWDKQKLGLWKFDFIDSTKSVLKKTECMSIAESYLNPYANNESAPMQVLTDCEATLGATGSALVNKNQEVVGNLSQEMSGALYNFFKITGVVAGELGRYFHFGNITCLPSLNPNYDAKKCNPNVNLNQLDFLRAEILRGEDIHTSEMDSYELELEEPQKYFAWDIEFVPNQMGSRFEMNIKRPKCIYKSSEWIEEFRAGRRSYYTFGSREIKLDNVRFSTKLNRYLRSFSQVETDGQKTFTIEFNPHGAHFRGESFVTIKSTLFGETQEIRFENIKPCL